LRGLDLDGSYDKFRQPIVAAFCHDLTSPRLKEKRGREFNLALAHSLVKLLLITES